MDTSSSPPCHLVGPGFFLLQEGLVPWEEPAPRVEGGDAKTLSFIVRDASQLTDTFRWLMTAGPEAFALNPTRVHVAELPVGLGALATERLLRQMCIDAPGTSGTTVERLSETSVCCIARITRLDQVSLGYLTAYRSTVVVTAGDAASLEKLPHAMAHARRGFAQDGLLGLREAEPRFCLTRALELETHCTLQVIGAIDVMTERESTVASAGLRRIVNLTDVPAAIRRLTTSLPPS